MRKSDHLPSWHGKPEVYKWKRNGAKRFILTLNYQRVNYIHDDDNGSNVDPDLDSVDYPECQIERINNAVFVIT